MKAYKGFGKDMKCRGYQYEEGQTYELTKDETPKLCECGFHACEAPIDCLSYYAPSDSVYHEVDLDGVTDETSDNSKRVGSKIKIGAKLDVAGIVKAQFEFTKEKCVNIQTCGDRSALTGGDMSALTGGDMSVIRGGTGSKFRGGKWAVFAAEILDDDGNIIDVKISVVDNETLKQDTWYAVVDGKWEEVEE